MPAASIEAISLQSSYTAGCTSMFSNSILLSTASSDREELDTYDVLLHPRSDASRFRFTRVRNADDGPNGLVAVPESYVHTKSPGQSCAFSFGLTRIVSITDGIANAFQAAHR